MPYDAKVVVVPALHREVQPDKTRLRERMNKETRDSLRFLAGVVPAGSCRLSARACREEPAGHPVVGEFLVCKRCGKYRSR